jgi:hypothetical protein
MKYDWKKMLLDMGIDDDKVDKLLPYIEVHVDYELNTKITNIVKSTTLGIAVSILNKIDKNKVKFVKLNDDVRTNVLQFEFDENISEEEANTVIINETVKMLNHILETKKINIFLLASEINIVDDTYIVFNRFYLGDEI